MGDSRCRVCEGLFIEAPDDDHLICEQCSIEQERAEIAGKRRMSPSMIQEALVTWDEAQNRGVTLWKDTVITVIRQHERWAENISQQGNLEALQRWVEAANNEATRIARMNLLNECFYIWQDGELGTVNGLRLGRLPSVPVPTSEINAALGEVAALLSTLCKRVDAKSAGSERLDVSVEDTPVKVTTGGFKPKAGRIYVRGSLSYIVKWNDPSCQLPLYLTESNIQWYFHLPRFNEGLGGLLSIFEDIVEVLRSDSPELEPVIKVQGQKVGGFSIKYKTGEETEWTAGWRHFLINLKWLIGVFSTQGR